MASQPMLFVPGDPVWSSTPAPAWADAAGGRAPVPDAFTQMVLARHAAAAPQPQLAIPPYQHSYPPAATLQVAPQPTYIAMHAAAVPAPTQPHFTFVMAPAPGMMNHPGAFAPLPYAQPPPVYATDAFGNLTPVASFGTNAAQPYVMMANGVVALGPAVASPAPPGHHLLVPTNDTAANPSSRVSSNKGGRPAAVVYRANDTAPSSKCAANGVRSTAAAAAAAVSAPLTEPLKAFVSEISAGLVDRAFGVPCGPVTPIAPDRLRSLIDLTYATFSTDRDLMQFVKTHFSVELCHQLRDYLLEEHNACLKLQDLAPDNATDATPSVLKTDLIVRRGVLTVSIIEVLATVPTPCSAEVQLQGLSDNKIDLTSFCPLNRAIFCMFGELIQHARGCIALLRVFSSTASAPRPVDNMVRLVTAHLEQLVFDAHGNYLVSHVLCACEESDVPAIQRVFEPIPRDEMEARTPIILALASTASTGKGPSTTHAEVGAPPAVSGRPPASRRVARANPAVYRAFVVRLVDVLTADVVRVGTHREASHVLEHAIRRLPIAKIPEAAALLDAVAASVNDTLLPLYSHACGRHCVQALAEVLAVHGAGIRSATASHCARTLVELRSALQLRPGVPTQHLDALDAALRRLSSTGSDVMNGTKPTPAPVVMPPNPRSYPTSPSFA